MKSELYRELMIDGRAVVLRSLTTKVKIRLAQDTVRYRQQKLPVDGQLALYNSIMHGVLSIGGLELQFDEKTDALSFDSLEKVLGLGSDFSGHLFGEVFRFAFEQPKLALVKNETEH